MGLEVSRAGQNFIIHTCRLYTRYAPLGNDGLFAGSALQAGDDNDWPTRHGISPVEEAAEALSTPPDQRSSRGGDLLVQHMISLY
jgi:hypothetical protein